TKESRDKLEERFLSVHNHEPDPKTQALRDQIHSMRSSWIYRDRRLFITPLSYPVFATPYFYDSTIYRNYYYPARKVYSDSTLKIDIRF
ncbi:MAG: hypothetical protein AAF558_15790, partial [Verrucomicrobiota bacterium]